MKLFFLYINISSTAIPFIDNLRKLFSHVKSFFILGIIKFIMSLKNILLEALPLRMAKDYTKMRKHRSNDNVDKFIDDIMDKLKNYEKTKFTSKRNERIYIPFTSSTDQFDETQIEKNSKAKDNLNDIVQFISFSSKYIYSEPWDNEIDFKINYVNGTIDILKEKRTYKLNKFLLKLQDLSIKKISSSNNNEEQKNNAIEFVKGRLKNIINDYVNVRNTLNILKPTEYYIVFSSHPYDIAGMSTDRGWEGCMTLFYKNEKNKRGSNADFVQYDITKGSIIAYLVKTEDTNINNPTSRVLIPVYVNDDDPNDCIYFPNRSVYGTSPKDFLETVIKILEDVQGEKEGFYSQFSCRYLDGNKRTLKKHKDIKNLIHKIKPIDKGSYYLSEGDVNLSDVGLTSLEFFDKPWIVEGDFDCNNNELTTLKGAPQQVGGDFDCSNNPKLTTLEGAPKEVGGGFFCHNNELTTLKGAPQKVGGSFICFHNNLTTLQGAPQEVEGYFDCNNNNELTTLKGAPKEVGGGFYCSNNPKLTTLEGAPKEVGGGFYCSNNPKLTTLEGAPQKVGRHFSCSNNPKLTQEEIDRYLRSIGKM